MSEAMRGRCPILPGLGPPVQILPQQHLSSASTSCFTIPSPHFQPNRRVRQHSSHGRHQHQRVLLLDNKSRSRSFSSSFHGDARALKQQRPWPKQKFKDAFSLHPSREPKRTVDAESLNRQVDESHGPPGNSPSLVTQLLTALDPQLPSASVDQRKNKGLNAPGNVHQGTASSTVEAVEPGSKASSLPVPTVSTTSEHRWSWRAEKRSFHERAPNSNNGQPGPSFETSHMLGKGPLQRSSRKSASSNSNSNSSTQIKARVDSKDVISNERVWRSPGAVAHLTAQDGLQSCPSYGSRAWSRDATQGIGSMQMHNAGTTSEAISVLKNRLQRGITTDSYTYVKVLQMCLKQKDLTAVKQVHDYITQSGIIKHPYVANTLLNVYVKCGEFWDARRVFDELEKKSVLAWNMMIAGYAGKGEYAKSAFELFNLMRQEGGQPDEVTYLSILKACASPSALKWGKEVHECIRHAGFELDVRVGTALVKMYAQCGCITEARRVFDKLTNRNLITWSVMIGAHAASGNVDDGRRLFDRMKKRDVITWTVMVGAYAECGRGEEAYRLFRQMRLEGFEPNAITYVSILNPSASAGALEWVKEVHDHATKAGLELDLRVGAALVHMYAESGSMHDARLVFDRLKTLNIITWNIMIGAYAERGRGEEAYRLFGRMRREGLEPDAITYVSILNASASVGSLEWVREVHGHATKAGLELDLRVGTALAHMYAESGSLADARLVFDRMEKRDLVTWTAMIGGLAQHGCAHEALDLFRKMNADLVKPDGTTFVAVLSACCHGGLVDDGRRLFSSMTRDYGIEPDIVHYNCMVDLLGRAGHLEEARLFISDMPIEPDVVTWTALLGACTTYRNVELGELAAMELFKLEPSKDSTYVLLSNIYAAVGKWEKVSLVRNMMQKRGVRKDPGRSWIEVGNKTHEFVVGDRSHPEAKAIYSELNKLTEKLKAEGYIPDTRVVLHNINEEDKELAVCSHSEKLAIAYGLMHTPHGEPIRVWKNLRVCPDCHTATKVISKVTGREIIARDANRFHHFKDGVCSCGDYW